VWRDFLAHVVEKRSPLANPDVDRGDRLSLGHPGDFKHPEVQAAFARIIGIVEGSGKALGVLAANTEASLEWKARGARYIMSVFEAIMGPAIRGYLKTVRES